jgi:glutaredoxin
VKGYLSQKGIAFEVRDITADETAQNELIEMGFQAIPVIKIGNQPPILGADYKKIDTALAAAS